MELAVLGPVEGRLDGSVLDLGTPKQRALVAALALWQGRPVAVDTLVGLVWGEAAPPAVTGTLHAYVSRLRKIVEPSRERGAPATVLVTAPPGYALRLPDGASDAGRFESRVVAQHRLLALPLLGPPTLPEGTLRRAVADLEEALGWWRGTPYAELGEAPEAVAERAHLDELRLVALEDRALALLALGRHGTTAAELEPLTSAHPLRERLWALRVLALVRSGRQGEALEVLGHVRGLLRDELGIDPGAELRDLQDRVLRQDPELGWVAPPADPPSVAGPDDPPSADPPSVAGPDDPFSADPPSVAGGEGGRGVLTAQPDWPMLGRDDELRRAEGALREALAGRTSFVVVTGDPGIGKSRLCAELGALAERNGARVLVGRCSQDDGAPPLWPWRGVLAALGERLPGAQDDGDQDDGSQDDGAQFRRSEQITRAVLEASRHQPLVVVLDDLHWADSATLRVLRLLAETSHADRLLVVTTWRDRPRPTGDLADVAETLARRHAVRVELLGLDAPAVAGVVSAVTSRRPSARHAGELRERTDGNPFFLIEYARLAGSDDALVRLLAEEHPPTAVQEVLARRLDRLPPDTVRVLRTAAVVGREWDVPTVAAAADADEDDLLDVVDPAQAAGLLREDGVDRFVFAHALVRDTLYAGLSPSRRARQHARVAELVAVSPGRETEEARHWLAAGPTHAARAWRAAVAAARVSGAAHAHREAADLYCQALEAQRDDPGATPGDEYDVLMALVTAYRWAAMWPELTATVERAVLLAERMGDPELATEAAISTTRGALWQPASHGEVHEPIVAALRRSLEAIPAGDSALRCRCMLSLASELYYAVSFAERRALVDEALAMAERLGDPTLLVDAYQFAYLSLWAPETAEERLRLAEKALALCREAGDEHGAVLCTTLRAVAFCELGRPAEMWQSIAEVRAEGGRLRLLYALLVVDAMSIAWVAMAGDFAECERLLARVVELCGQVSLKHADDAILGAVMTIGRWQGRSAELGETMKAMQGGPFEITATIVAFLWHGGREQEAREYADQFPVSLDHDDWFSALAWCNAAEVALYLDRPELGAAVYPKLAPLAGHACSAGSGNANGPVDAFLAMAAASVGERALATRHADAAEALCAAWEIPLCAQWVRAQRDRYGY